MAILMANRARVQAPQQLTANRNTARSSISSRPAIRRLGAADLEKQIQGALNTMLAAEDRDRRLVSWLLMCELLSQRSPRRIAQMERERGLRPLLVRAAAARSH